MKALAHWWSRRSPTQRPARRVNEFAALALVAGCAAGWLPVAWSQTSGTTGYLVSLRGGAQIHENLAREEALERSRGQALSAARREQVVDGQARANKARATALARRLGIEPQFTYGGAFAGFSAQLTQAQVDALRRTPEVESLSLDLPMTAQARPGGGGGGSTTQTTPWGVTRINAAGAANTGSGVHVFVVDSGIDRDHPDLAANILDGYAVEACVSSGKFSCSATWDDDQGHGSHVAGIIAAVNNSQGVVGVAPGVSLRAVKVLDRFNNTTAAKVAAGMDYVAQRTLALGTATVANVSIGGGGSKSGYCNANGYTGTDNYARAFCEAAKAGVVITVSAGNFGVNARGFLPSTYDDAVMAISAAWGGPDSTGGDWWWNDSNWGNETSSWNTRPSAPVALGAPGYGIYSTTRLENNGGYVSMTGTSMAAPHAAGAAALFLKKSPQGNSYSAFLNIRQQMLNASTSTSGFTNTSGYSHTENYLSVTPVR
ncbi:S8 family serine peptidase [Inhella gelatinilytica]|uniref:S8 family serine peptidase n=1 Tax=Inhella gelatinilytica TaxID=2795030 RepID=A0A931J2U9_9BURK|nr:S8 family serine peptidase [Inhella gelatinilytica]MBH9554311.1 S8 family serine peptidase [Inhella gelatinilytica]